MKERREFERFDLQLPVSVETEPPNRENEIFALKAGNIYPQVVSFFMLGGHFPKVRECA